ncbi:MAG: DNA polymerase I [Candidatus Dojkabacteria bacterium]|nr:MAG: DNA polymerase I [Candidatus Dojkabacteria bacterium]
MSGIHKGLLLAIDANSLLHRAYHAYPLTMVTSDGVPVNAAFGFTSMLLDTLLKYRPEYVFCAFDTHKPTFRHTDYLGYKMNRPKTDSELVDQIPLVDNVLNALNIPIFRVDGYEADDILGTVAAKAVADVHGPISNAFILTGDRDLYQLVNEKVQVVMPKGSFKNLQEYGETQVIESMGVPPVRITDLKGLMGDASDNIPGVKGIGPKTAADLITTFGSLEEIYQNIEEVAKKSKRIAEKLAEEQEVAVLSKQLATIKLDTPVTFKYDAALTSDFSLHKATALFTQYQFKSLLPRLKKFDDIAPKLDGQEQTETMEDVQSLTLKEEMSHWIGQLPDDLRGGDTLAALDRLDAVLLSSESHSFENMSGKGLGERVEFLGKILEELQSDAFSQFVIVYYGRAVYITDISDARLSLAGGAKIIFHGFFSYWNECVTGPEQSSLDKKQHEILKALFAADVLVDIPSLTYAMAAGRGDYDISQAVLQYGILPQHVSQQLPIIALMQAAKATVGLPEYVGLTRIVELWKQRPQRGDMTIPESVHLFLDKPAQFGVALMHLRGIGINPELVLEYGQSLEKEIATLEKGIFDDIGFEFNIRSPKQLGDILFSHLGLPSKKKTKTGFSTDDEVLQELLPAHPAVEKVLKYRQLSKLLNTYIRPFLDLAQRHNEATSGQQLTFGAGNVENSSGNFFRIHSEFDPMSTSSGRLSSSNPNLQNLPIKTLEGKMIRKFFVPEAGNVLISIDYSQIDLRVMAHISGDPGLLEAFTKERDVHRTTAAKIFGVDYADVNDSQRRIAKTVNFGLLYGMSAFGLSKSIGVSVKEADAFIKAYFESFPNVQKYMEETIDFASQYGYVLSLLGRRRYMYGIDANNQQRRQAAQREAINMPIQGGSDDIMRLALGQISLMDEVLSGKVRLVLQIHDELVFEAPDDEKFLKEFIPKLTNTMEHVLELAVPLKVEYAVGKNLDI